ncbi:suppressor of fused domain protein [Aureivirga sp. CE67]|uniref:suppressor of fused domain protein n=1 Tax=Aureivirga sp. CE67 TaxID=1788983 RepID=UPI0018CA7C6F|nr:suppressor of fused domain protein [Aureivirga sp. CE67]
MKKSESGAPIYRYDDLETPEFVAPSGDSSIEEISAHIEKHFGEIHQVFHEVISEFVHIDIHWVKPTKEKPFHTFITSGMSDKPMNSPEGVEGCEYLELSICLPENWEVSEESFKDRKNYWPIEWLKYLARFPHAYNTWLWFGHTIPNGEPAAPFAENTNFSSMILLPSVVFPQEAQLLELENKSIHFLALCPLYNEELELKMHKGVEALFDGFDKFRVSDIVDIYRPVTVKKKKFFGLF